MTNDNEFKGLLQVGWYNKETDEFEFIAQASTKELGIATAVKYLMDVAVESCKDSIKNVDNWSILIITSDHPAFVKAAKNG